MPLASIAFDNDTARVPNTITLLLGGVRAGKSAKAVELARNCEVGHGVLFVATAQPFDDEMRRRIDTHRRERPSTWDTLESPIHLAGDIEARLRHRTTPYGAIIIDCLTLWVSNLMLANGSHDEAESMVVGHIETLIQVLSTTGSPSFVISNEVGLGVVPPTPLGRAYRDALGRANQRMAAAAGDVRLMVAGLELALKSVPQH